MKEKLKKYLAVLAVLSLFIGGGMIVGLEEASAKSVIRSNDYEQNKLTGNSGDPFNYVYFSVPESAYLNTTASVKINNGIIYDTYRNYWVYYSSILDKYYP